MSSHYCSLLVYTIFMDSFNDLFKVAHVLAAAPRSAILRHCTLRSRRFPLNVLLLTNHCVLLTQSINLRIILVTHAFTNLASLAICFSLLQFSLKFLLTLKKLRVHL